MRSKLAIILIVLPPFNDDLYVYVFLLCPLRVSNKGLRQKHGELYIRHISIHHLNTEMAPT